MQRPIIFFDIESTGLNIVYDKIVQIAAIKLFPDGTIEEKNVLMNPGIPIPAEVTEVHGITDEMVQDKPFFKNFSENMFKWFSGCDLAGHNINGFDIPMLAEEFANCGIDFPDESVNIIDTFRIERIVNSQKLEACYLRYTGETLDDAHDALADSRASMAVYLAQKEKHDLPEDPTELELLCNDGKKRVDFAGKLKLNDDGEICYAFGNSNGVPVIDDPGFGRWILSKDFPLDTKKWIRTILDNG